MFGRARQIKLLQGGVAETISICRSMLSPPKHNIVPCTRDIHQAALPVHSLHITHGPTITRLPPLLSYVYSILKTEESGLDLLSSFISTPTA
ncbi:hypothetical protein J6590_079090 [Homalodisca vitripennis]|nr:hypothetical protein J6590_079090 [Homalodisca vitripennis]